MPLMDVVRLDTMVTVVDSGVFLDAYISKDKLAKRPELGTLYLHYIIYICMCVCVDLGDSVGASFLIFFGWHR